MGFFAGLTAVSAGIGLVSSLVGGSKESKAHKAEARGHRDAARAAEASAANIEELALKLEDLTEAEQAFLLEQADIEARLIAEGIADEQELIDFNIDLARKNAAWEREVGRVATELAAEEWGATISTALASFGASGTVAGGGSNTLVMRGLAEKAEREMYYIGLNAERAALIEEDRGRYLALQREQLGERSERQVESRLRLGDLEAETAGIQGEVGQLELAGQVTEAEARARASRHQASAARSRSSTATINSFTDVAFRTAGFASRFI